MSGSPRSWRFRWKARIVVKTEVSVVDFQCKRGQRRADEPSSAGTIRGVVGIPASGLVALDALVADDLIADPIVPPRPRGAAVLIERQCAVVPVIIIR